MIFYNLVDDILSQDSCEEKLAPVEFEAHNFFVRIRGAGMAKIIQIEQRTEVDYETGQVSRATDSRVIHLPQEPPYVKMYIDDVSKLLDVPPGPRMVLHQLVRKLDYEGFISLTPASRERIAKACQIGVPTMSNYITQLCKAGILKHAGRGEFEMNPHLFAKGDWKDIAKRRQAFELSIKYSEDGTRTLQGRAVPAETQLELDVDKARG